MLMFSGICIEESDSHLGDAAANISGSFNTLLQKMTGADASKPLYRQVMGRGTRWGQRRRKRGNFWLGDRMGRGQDLMAPASPRILCPFPPTPAIHSFAFCW